MNISASPTPRLGSATNLHSVKRSEGHKPFGPDGAYSGVRLHCKKCGLVKLTVDQLRKLARVKCESRRCPRCGSVADFI